MKSISRGVYGRSGHEQELRTAKTVKIFAGKPYTNIMPCKVPWWWQKGQSAKPRCRSAVLRSTFNLSLFVAKVTKNLAS